MHGSKLCFATLPVITKASYILHVQKRHTQCQRKRIASIAHFIIIPLYKSQEVKNYSFSVNLDMKQNKVHVEGSMKVDFKDKDTIALVLWKQTSIQTIKGSRSKIAFRFDTVAPSPILFVSNGRVLTLTKKAGTPALQTVYVSYDCHMKGLNRWAQTFLDEWVELNMYSAWFPLNNESKNFTSIIDITKDKAYKVTGSGIISGKNGHWLMKQPWPAYYNVIVASRDLKTKQNLTPKSHIELNYSTLKENEADSIFTECKFIFDLYTKLFGLQDSTYFKLVLVPVDAGGGYSRKTSFPGEPIILIPVPATA